MFLRGLTMGCFCGKETVCIDNNKYTVKERLGEGGFSVIDLVRDSQSHRLHALKRILCHSESDEKNGLEEAEYMKQLKHPNLVPCVAHGVRPISKHRTAISEVLIVMPYYQKGSVFDEAETLRSRATRMPEKRVIALLRGICEGLYALHHRTPIPLAHRDVKPHNVMLEVGVDGGDIPVLMDFGSMGPARQEIRSASQAAILQDFASEKCSMPYRAPELFHVDSRCTIDESVDIWSLGCTLYAMCFYESPFDKVHQRGDSIALAAMAGNIRVPHTGIYSDELMSIMSSMLSVTPSQRPTALQIITSLTSLRSNTSGVPPHQAPPAPSSIALSSASVSFHTSAGAAAGEGAEIGRSSADTSHRL